jgi:integrase
LARITLTEKFITSAKRVPAVGRVDYHDSLVPGLALRVSEHGHRSFVLIGRFAMNSNMNPTRRALGQHGELTLEEAREKARDWLRLIRQGKDPRIEEAKARAAAQRSQSNTFAHVAEEFLSRHAAKLAKAAEARRIIEVEFVKRWGARPVTDIMPEDVASAIRTIAKRSEAMAHISLGYLRRLYSWAIGSHEFGVASSPVERLKPADLIGQRVIRERVLTDDELRKVWDAADQDGYPFGAIVKMLVLTGQRLNEIAALSWNEVDKTLITIPSSRMKSKRAHEVPLAPDALALMKDLPRFRRGEFVFTSTSGAKPFVGFSKGKRRLDAASGVTEWTLHDLRRTARTHFSALPVQDNVRELVIAHARPGLHAVYDQHTYQDEKRECLRLWELRLAGIVNPQPVKMARRPVRIPAPRRPARPLASPSSDNTDAAAR